VVPPGSSSDARPRATENPAGRPPAAFYFDLASPEAYLAAERALRVLPGPCEWVPIHAARLPHAEAFEAYRCANEELIFREEIARRARIHGLQPVRWPVEFPCDSRLAMLAATYAKRIGRTVPFALAAFRQAFAAGRDLSIEENVLIAAAACEIHPAALIRALASRGVRDELDRASADALELGVIDVPAVRVGDRVFVGDARLEEAGRVFRGVGDRGAVGGGVGVGGVGVGGGTGSGGVGDVGVGAGGGVGSGGVGGFGGGGVGG
jgi:2-hydroxychromene-2-carboxylate isomerase